MNTAGIICEYNPFHLGHSHHIEKTKEALGGDACIVCVMSGNFVQRGDVAIFNKHARAEMAVRSGADLVIELPVPYALQSAQGFARASVHLLDSLGVCGYLSFGSESGNVKILSGAAEAIVSAKAEAQIRKGLDMGLPYAKAQQMAADALLGRQAGVFKSPNNTLGIEYIKALNRGSRMRPMTVLREGGEHDSNTGLSASALRKAFCSGDFPALQMPKAAAAVAEREIATGRGPVSMLSLEQAIMSRLRSHIDFSQVTGAADGLDCRFSRMAKTAPSVSALLADVKTKRHVMSRIRRVLFCAVLGITNDDVQDPPPYIRVLAMNKRGMQILKNAAKTATLPIVTKPALMKKLGAECVNLFAKECAAADLYTLGCSNEKARIGGTQWRTSPVVTE